MQLNGTALYGCRVAAVATSSSKNQATWIPAEAPVLAVETARSSHIKE